MDDIEHALVQAAERVRQAGESSAAHLEALAHRSPELRADLQDALDQLGEAAKKLAAVATRWHSNDAPRA